MTMTAQLQYHVMHVLLLLLLLMMMMMHGAAGLVVLYLLQVQYDFKTTQYKRAVGDRRNLRS